MPLNSRKSAAARTLEPGPLPTIDNSPQQATSQRIDIDRRIDDLYLYLLYIDYLFAEVWLAVRQLWPASAYQGAPANDTFTIEPSKGLDRCVPAVNSSQSPTHSITSRHTDNPLYNRRLACNWLSEEGSGTCNRQFGSRKDLMSHLNHVHGVKGPAKRLGSRVIYLLSSIMISEAALALVRDKDLLPPFGQRGGVLTPMTAFGDVLIQRLNACGRISVESEVVPAEGGRKKDL
ncbi:hypothetical protein EDC04DRAFT_2890874 [Pisolithus marmoratus]|nr:hypothetical protein EDC04DRAFT_2890874 [Pisolithus marmoratus]